MEKINFVNGSLPALNATNLNKLQDNIEDSMKSIQTNSDIDTYSCNYVNNKITNINGQVLWENSSPTISIDNDTNITLNNDDYDIILWLFRYSSSVNQIISSHSIKGYGTKVSNILVGGVLRERSIEYNNETSYCIKYTGNGGALIPIYAIGYKTGLF